MVKVKVIPPPPGVEALATTPNPGTTVWVPMWNLAGGSSNAYKGDWAAGTYYPGDHVVYNGILYECVRQTTAAPVPWPPAPGAASYGTTLPASPIDGQEHVLVNSVTAPDWQWRFRYNAGNTTAYKWEFIGGAPYSVVGGSMNTSSTTPVVITGAPTFTFPRAGIYTVLFGGLVQNNGGTVSGAYAAPMQIYVNGAAVGGQAISTPTAGYVGTSISQAVPGVNPAAGQGLDMRGWNGSAGPTTAFSQCWFQIVPVRLS